MIYYRAMSNNAHNRRSQELDAYAARLNAAYAEREALLKADADGTTLHAEIVPTICKKCGGMDRSEQERPSGCPHCLIRFMG